jgi:hypothetical protein
MCALSADEFEGRGPGTGGDAAARRWIAEQLSEAGYQPGMPGGAWQQPFDIVGITASMPERWSFRGGRQTVSFTWWDEYIAASGVQKERVGVEDAEVVFVGYGMVAPEEQWDDFGDADLDGKILLMLNDDPSTHPDLFGGERRLYYGRWTYKYESAARRGAAGAIIIHTEASAGYPWRVVQTSWDGEQVELPAGDGPRTPIHGWLTEEGQLTQRAIQAAESVFLAAGQVLLSAASETEPEAPAAWAPSRMRRHGLHGEHVRWQAMAWMGSAGRCGRVRWRQREPRRAARHRLRCAHRSPAMG